MRWPALAGIGVAVCLLVAGCGPDAARQSAVSSSAVASPSSSAAAAPTVPANVALTPDTLQVGLGGKKHLTLRVTGRGGLPVPGASVWVRSTGVCGGSNAGCVSLGSPPQSTAVVTTDAAGQAGLDFTGVTPGQGKITAQAAPAGVDPRTAATAEAVATVAVSGVVVAPAIATVHLTATPQTIAVGGTSVLLATFTDVDGNGVSGADVQFGYGGTTLGTERTGADGTATYTFAPKAEGQVSVWAGLNGSQSPSASASVVVLPAGATAAEAPAALWFSGSPITAIAGQTEAVAVHVVNAQGQPVAGAPVLFSTTGSAAGTWTEPGPVPSNAQGVATDTFTAGAAGETWVSAAADAPGGDPAHTELARGSAQLWLFPAGAPQGPVPASVRVVVTPEIVASGQQAMATAVVTGPDGLPAAGMVVSFALPTGDGTTSTTVDAVTGTGGRATIPLPKGKPGEWWVSAGAVPAALRGVAGVTGVEGLAPVLLLPPGDTGEDVPASLHLVAGGDGTTITATVTNAAGHAVGGAALFGPGPYSGNAAAVTDAHGQATLTAVPGQPLQVIATAPGLDDSQGVVGQPIGQAIAILKPAPMALTVSADPGVLRIGGTTTVSAKVTDATGHPVADAAVAFSILPTADCGALACRTLPVSAGVGATAPVPTDATGIATVTVSGLRPGGARLNAVVAAPGGDPRQSPAASAQLGLVVGATAGDVPSTMEVTPAPATVVVGQTLTLHATVRDAQGKPMAGVPVRFEVPAGGGCGGGPGQYPLPPGFGVVSDDGPILTGADGTAAATFLATQGEQVRLDVTAGVPGENLTDGAPALSSTAVVTILPQAYRAAQIPTAMTLDAQPVAVGGTGALSAQVKGADGAPVAGAPVTFSVVGDAGAAAIGGSERVLYTDAHGLVRGEVTGLAPGQATIEVHVAAPGLGLDPDQAASLDSGISVNVTGAGA